MAKRQVRHPKCGYGTVATAWIDSLELCPEVLRLDTLGLVAQVIKGDFEVAGIWEPFHTAHEIVDGACARGS